METLIITGQEYSIGRLNALDQLHVSRKIAPIIPNLIPIISEVAKGDLTKTIEAIESMKESGALDQVGDELNGLEPLANALTPLMDVFAQMPEDDVDYIVHKCLSVVKRNGAVVCRGTSIMFDDIELAQILPLAVAVIRKNLGNFIQDLLTKASNLKQVE
jgi:hypothetical protein